MPETSDLEAFRAEVRDFLAARLPEQLRAKVLGHLPLDRADILRWHAILHEHGWLAPNWPVEHGGTGWSVEQQYAFDEECCIAGAPETLPFGLRMVAPVLMAFGTEQQKARHLPRILGGQDWWCQGYSEPGSGSDLASLRTRAEPTDDGEAFVVNGQKTWTTYAQYANRMFCLVRTDPGAARPQAGISFLLIDMASPGITVRPIRTIDGGQEINEVFLDNVRVPRDNLVGKLNGGWDCAKLLLRHERMHAARIGRSKRELAFLKRIAGRRSAGGRPLAEDPEFARRIALLEIDLLALEQANLRLVETMQRGEGHGAEASILKYLGTTLTLKIVECAVEMAGIHTIPVRDARSRQDGDMAAAAGPAWADPLAAFHLNLRKIAIYGGSSEIQKNIIAKTALGL
ncbi:acyl-CoA dehydrogenase family protein [Streptomyces odontomachi]|uniref:acyl-CoA dehydrogenase family protein n=1 Tax=Streptomyces odontomachi TaxID=2944940 RepID=UPI0021088F29|nr:acyl-CoA dehydrogenase family protein [Streptomyces sp. ODS25]